MKPRALDLFCGAGGASMGLYRAGFDVTGVDIVPQKRYPFRFVQADALRPPFDLAQFDFVWASPPCERYTNMWLGRDHMREKYPGLVAPVRAMLSRAGVPFVMENVPGAPLRPDVVLTGAMFDLPIIRDRIFECHRFPVPFALAPQHRGTVSNGDLACVVGCGANNAHNRRGRKGRKGSWLDLPPDLRARLLKRNCAQGWRDAMGIDWMTRNEIRKAIPPAYSEFIGLAALSYMRAAA
jgi:DNA (cytosine-5)-methyltransferase 1